MVSWELHRGAGPNWWDRTAVAVPGRGFVYSFGGAYRKSLGIKVRVLSPGTYEWRNIPAANKVSKPAIREAHSIVIYQDKVYLWGGNPSDNVLWCFDLDTEQWSLPDVSGPRPEARWHHSACVIGRNMIIFGGCYYLTGKICNDLWILNLVNYKWKKKDTRSTCCRCGHTATVFDNKMFVLGGHERKNAIRGKDFIQVYNHDRDSWDTPSIIGEVPTSMYWHSAARYRNGIYIFGGYVDGDDASNRSNDLYHYNTGNGYWTKVVAMENQPSPRRSHVGLVYQKKLIVFGGH